MKKLIEHEGVVKQVCQSKIEVLITQNSACSGCHAKAACTSADCADKIIEIPYRITDIKSGDKVYVTGSRSIGYFAVLYAFIIPFFLTLTLLIMVFTYTQNELIAGISSIGILIPYYIIIYLFRNNMKQKLTFTIQKNQ